MSRGTGGYKTRNLHKKHGVKHVQGVRYALNNGELIYDKIMGYFMDESNPSMSIDEFRVKFPYVLCYLPLRLIVNLSRSICVCSDGIVRRRDNTCIDSGIGICAASNKIYYDRMVSDG
jgi:hypothetical protein